jgi:predicted nucleotide-binding protein (sugar kinase/HSP70/actin superfamily)
MRLHATAQPIDCTFIGGGALMSATPHVTPAATMLRSRTEVEQEIARQLEAERARLQRQAGLDRERVSQFHRPVERPFKAEERDQVTILFGGLTWKHEWLIKSVFQSAGYKVEILPTPDVASFQLGKEYGNNGQCNPTYFTVGHLIKYLQSLEATGLSREEIVDKYVFFTAGSCGPCRFGMYEAEYRLGVENAGFPGFRVLLFQQNDGIRAASGEPGLKFTVDFGLGAFMALNAGDIMNDIANQIRPFEVKPGETERVTRAAMDRLTSGIRDRQMFEIDERAPAWLKKRLEGRKGWRNTLNTLGKIHDHFYGEQTKAALKDARDTINAIEVDRLRVKPVVKVTGEFWAQTTEGDGNFHMFEFLEREGAQIIVEPIGNWIMYLLWQAKENQLKRRGVDERFTRWEIGKKLKYELNLRKKLAMFGAGKKFYNRQYDRLIEGLGGIGHPLSPMDKLIPLAAPYYHKYARGGEGNLEVAKNIYYTVNKKAHMVLSLKPFGCMPSSQSDGVQSAVMNHFKDMIFLPIETSGEGEINAHSRVQMALGEAKVKAKGEFQEILASTGKRLEDIRAYVDDHPEMKRPFYHVPHKPGVTGTAATFVLHVSDRMDTRRRRRPFFAGFSPRPAHGA